MPSTKSKIQLYVDRDVEPYLRNWLIERQFTSESIGLNQLLREHFNIEPAPQDEATDWKHLIGAEIQAALMPLAEKITTIDRRLWEIEEQFKQERESPQLSINQEAIESVWMQEEVIKELQAEIDSLKESPREFPDTATEPEATITPEISIEHCAARAIAILEAQFVFVSRAMLETYPAEELLDLIYHATPELTAEQADEVLRELFKRIPANPPLAQILESDEPMELNLEGDSPDDSPGESEPEEPLEELNHKELALRLHVKTNTLRGARNREGFATWTQQHDAYGLAWKYDSEAKVYRGFKIKSI